MMKKEVCPDHRHEWVYRGCYYRIMKDKPLSFFANPVATCENCSTPRSGFSQIQLPEVVMEQSFHMAVLVSEDFHDFRFLRAKLDALTLLKTAVMVHSISPYLVGTTLPEKWAIKNWWPMGKWIRKEDVKKWPAKKKLYKQMVKEIDALVIFWDGIGDRDIRYILKKAKRNNLSIREYLV